MNGKWILKIEGENLAAICKIGQCFISPLFSAMQSFLDK